MKIANCFLLFLCSTVLYAQKFPIKFGEIPLADMKMIEYDKDSSADAVVLSDYGTAEISLILGRAQLQFERHTRIKILKKTGFRWADAIIPLYHDGTGPSEKITKLKASTYNLENGRMVETPLSKENIFTESFNRDYILTKFTFPNVKVGSVVEFKVTITSDYVSNFPNWEFQREIPTRFSEYKAGIPDQLVFDKYMQGYITPTVYEAKPRETNGGLVEKLHHWIFEDVPAFKKEPYMTCEKDYVSKINFSLSYVNGKYIDHDIISSWETLNEKLLASEYFGQVVRKSTFLKSETQQVTEGIADPTKKIEAIHNFVKQNIEWNNINELLCDNPKKVFEKKKGSSADINLLMGAMLDKAGFAVDLVILSTRDHGFIRRQYPMIRQFNYVICSVKIDGTTLLLDATEKYLPVNVLPERCLNGQGFLISATSHGWINVVPMAKSQTTTSAEFALNDGTHVKGNLKFTRSGYDAFSTRKDFFTKGEEGYVKSLFSGKQWDTEKTEFKNMNQLDLPAESVHTISINDYCLSSGNMRYINPFLDGQLKENPFKSEVREYPIDFGTSLEKIYMAKFTIPDGFDIEELPTTGIYVMPGKAAKYTYSLTQTGNRITLVSNLQINKSLFTQLEYPDLREFYSKVVAKQAQQIVLKKR